MLTRKGPHLAVAIAVATILSITSAPAFAGGVGGSVDCQQDPTNPSCTIQVGTPGDPGGPGTNTRTPCHGPGGEVEPCYVDGVGYLGDDGCWWRPLTPAELAQTPDLFPPPAPPGQWYVGSCGTPPNNFPVTKYRVFNGPPNAAVLAAAAVKALRLPTPMIRWNPPSSTNVLVNVPVWLWLDPASWGTRSATASVPGLSVTATATPASLVFSTGDGATVACAGPGTAWSPTIDPRAASPTCGHTYSAPSTGGTFTLSATVTWHVAWAGGGQTGVVPDLQTTAQVALAVGESQTVTGAGAGRS
jgi:hypothetical protein